jgi:hypothetical protein
VGADELERQPGAGRELPTVGGERGKPGDLAARGGRSSAGEGKNALMWWMAKGQLVPVEQPPRPIEMRLVWTPPTMRSSAGTSSARPIPSMVMSIVERKGSM